MIEKVVSFGPRGELVGILVEPDAGRARPDAPAVLMWNVGVNHRVGPFRVYVDLCRRLAEEGFVALRFDSSGIGDSELRREAVSDEVSAQLDVRDAMDLVARRTGARGFVLVGFCSSVDAAHMVALVDRRVVGVVHIEGYAYRTRGFRLRFPLRLLSRERWKRYLKLQLGKILTGETTAMLQRTAREEIYQREHPPWDQFTRDLESLAARGTRLLFIYVGGDTHYNYEEQFFEMFPGRGLREKTDVAFFAGADHTFFRADVRRSATERVCRFVRTCSVPDVAAGEQAVATRLVDV